MLFVLNIRKTGLPQRDDRLTAIQQSINRRKEVVFVGRAKSKSTLKDYVLGRKVNLVFTPHLCLGRKRKDLTLMLLSKMSIPFSDWSLLNSGCQGKLGRDCCRKMKCSYF